MPRFRIRTLMILVAAVALMTAGGVFVAREGLPYEIAALLVYGSIAAVAFLTASVIVCSAVFGLLIALKVIRGHFAKAR